MLVALFASPIAVVAGSVAWTAPGAYSLLVPQYNVFNLDLRGAGGGGGGRIGVSDAYHFLATAGGYSYFNGPTQSLAYGGNPGAAPPVNGSFTPAPNGADGSGYGGNVVVGGGAPGGAGLIVSTIYLAGNGGAGGRVYYTWSRGQAGAPVPGQTYAVGVGAGGLGGYLTTLPAEAGAPGGNGAAYFSWS